MADKVALFNEKFSSAVSGWSVYQISASGRLASVSLGLERVSACEKKTMGWKYLLSIDEFKKNW